MATGVIAAFPNLDDAIHAIEELRQKKFMDITAYTPTPRHEFEPWQWGSYAPTWVDYAILLGSFGWFFMWFLLFIKQLPVMALAEIKEIIPPKMRKPHAGQNDIEHGGMANPLTSGGPHTTGGTH